MNTATAARIAARSLVSLATDRPICVSFEVTHACPADCLHCDKGGMKREDKRLGPEDYRRLARELSPTVVQLSGGEPLTRKDLEDIARAVKNPGGPPLVICVSNGWLFSEERYRSLMAAGVDLFSVSLDFPDERHDGFRQIPGLYAKLDSLLPRLVKLGHGNIALNSALTRANFAEIPGLVANAERWGVRISFSAYSALRTGDRDLCIESPQDLDLLARHFDFLLRHRERSDTVISSPWILKNTLRFFQQGGHLGGCRAGVRFLVVRPDGLINACSMFPDQQFRSREEARRGFRTRDTCDECFVTIRSATERPFGTLVGESLATWRSLLAR
jgi:MoaA/NifB/PqqE/SkfB family radical SAM enzyme